MAKSTYGVDVGTVEHRYFYGEDSVYSALATELGWTKNYSGNLPMKKFSGRDYDVMRQRITVSGRRAAATGGGSRSFSGQVWCATDKVEDALGGLPGKIYGDAGTISRAYIRSGGRSVS
jgi:hypothetical protein